MEPGSFTSEPQYQRPDQRNSDIDYIRRPEPVQAPAVVPGVAPVPPAPEFGWDPLFARRPDFTDAKFIESMTPFYGQSFYYLVELVNALLVSLNTAKDVVSLVPYI